MKLDGEKILLMDAIWVIKRIGNFLVQMSLVILLIPCYFVHAQLTGYGSVSYGYHCNPLYNYEKISDQVKQSYLEVKNLTKYEQSQLGFYYVGSLSVFNRLSDRNYYEHGFESIYNVTFVACSQYDLPQVDSTEEEEIMEDEDFSSQTVAEDSTARYLSIAAKLNGRHDKSIFNDFDNYAVEVPIDYRFMLLDDLYLKLSNNVTCRDYSNLNELSNVTDLFSLTVGNKTNEPFIFGFHIDGGIKHYLKDLIDTSRFELVRSYLLKSDGKGKPGAKIKVPSTKIILTNPDDINAYQLSAGTAFGEKWVHASLVLEFTYRHNFNSSTRSLAQYTNATFLTEDIYNDFFSYGGIEADVRYKQELPFGLESIVTLRLDRKKYGAPALNLAGDQTSGNRIDLRFAGDMYLQKFIDVSSHIGMGFYIACTVQRNQSNSDYNDYSLWNVMTGIGFGFY